LFLVRFANDTDLMTSPRKHPSAPFWATVVVAAGLVGYVAGFGPVLAFYRTGIKSDWIDPLMRVYRPMLTVKHRAPEPVRTALEGYARHCECLWD
jgi:hypothetical protein